jgi:hypothetical protein
MRGRSGVTAPASKTRQDAWNEPIRNDGQQKHARFIWIAKWGNGSMSSGPTGCKATARARLARSLAERPVVSKVVTDRQTARVEAKRRPPAVIWPGPLVEADRHFYE